MTAGSPTMARATGGAPTATSTPNSPTALISPMWPERRRRRISSGPMLQTPGW